MQKFFSFLPHHRLFVGKAQNTNRHAILYLLSFFCSNRLDSTAAAAAAAAAASVIVPNRTVVRVRA